MAATTKKLDMGSVPPRATSSRAIRNEVVPSNGQTFNMNNTIIFDLPSNLNNTFWDAQSSYVSLNFKNTQGTHAVNFEGGGFPSCIKRIVIELGGQTLFSCDNWNSLYQMMFDLDTATQFRDNAGKVLFGSGSDFSGSPVAGANGQIKVCFPLVLTPLMTNKYWPLIGRDRIRIRLELDTAHRSLICADAAVTDADIEITSAKLVMYNLELGSDVMAQVAAASGGSFKLACPSYQHHQSSLASGESSLSATLGFSMSSLNRIIVAQQLQAVTATSAYIGNRSRADLERFSVTIGGVKYPQRDILENGDGSETLAEALVSQRALTTWGHQSSVNIGGGFAADEPTGANDGATGHYLLDVDLESQRVDSGSLVAGVNCVGQVVQAQFNYTAGVTAAHVVNVYGEHTVLCMLDLNTLSWTIAV